MNGEVCIISVMDNNVSYPSFEADLGRIVSISFQYPSFEADLGRIVAIEL